MNVVLILKLLSDESPLETINYLQCFAIYIFNTCVQRDEHRATIFNKILIFTMKYDLNTFYFLQASLIMFTLQTGRFLHSFVLLCTLFWCIIEWIYFGEIYF